MSDLQVRFAQAQQDVSALAERPDNNTMLKLDRLAEHSPALHSYAGGPTSAIIKSELFPAFQVMDLFAEDSWRITRQRPPS